MNLDVYCQHKAHELAEKLKIKKSFAIITDWKVFVKLYPAYKKHKKDLGVTNKDDRNIYIAIKAKYHDNHKELDKTIYHELLHIKFPNTKEADMEKLEKKFNSVLT
jgi:hypothetical protein